MRNWVTTLLCALCLLLLVQTSLPSSIAYAEDYSPLYAGLVLRRNDGKVLYQHSADQQRHPASLTKMMTLHLLFDALRSGKVKMQSSLPVSSYAARQPRSNLNMRPGSRISVRDAIHALIIHSANDVAVVVAEALGGNEAHFVQMMNKKAAALGMENTHFRNPHGLHDEDQLTTARDMAKLAVALHKNHPQYIPLFSKKSFTYKGRIIHTHNRVINRFHGANGMKTGYVRASGFNVVTTTHRPEGDLVAVVMGGYTAKDRDDHMIELLNKSYLRLADNEYIEPERRGPGQYKNMFAVAKANNAMAASIAAGNKQVVTTEEQAPADTGATSTRPDVFAPLDKQKVAEVSASLLEDEEDEGPTTASSKQPQPKTKIKVAKKAKVTKIAQAKVKAKKPITVANKKAKSGKILTAKTTKNSRAG